MKMTLRRKLKSGWRRIIGAYRIRRALYVPKQRMAEVEHGCHVLIRLGFLKDYEFVKEGILFDWQWHPVNIMPTDVAEQTVLRFTGKLEEKWRWSMRKTLRAIRVYRPQLLNPIFIKFRFPVDYRF